jgi:ribosomal protein S18 acetylase RimI-like enzyme
MGIGPGAGALKAAGQRAVTARPGPLCDPPHGVVARCNRQCEAVDLTLRHISPSDKRALARFHDRLSDETRYRRYHGHKGQLTRGDLRYLTEVDGHDHVALVAEDARGELQGVARAIATAPGGPDAELAVVVADDLQAEGVGRDLVGALVAQVAREGRRRIVLEVQADNHRALRFFQGLGARQVASAHGVCELVIEPHAPPAG